MTAKEFTRSFAKLYQVRIKDAGLWVNAIFEYLGDVIANEKVIRLPVIGSFKKDYIYPRVRYDCNTGEPVEYPGRMTVKFTVSGALDKRLRALPIDQSVVSAEKQRRMIDRHLPSRIREPEVEEPEEVLEVESDEEVLEISEDSPETEE